MSRASCARAGPRLALGYRCTEVDKTEREHWGDIATGRDHACWTLNRGGCSYHPEEP